MVVMNRASSTGTVATVIYQRLRDEIICGKFGPGTRLKLSSLQERYDAGTSPIREALNRLSSEGLVIYSDQKGFRVAPVSIDALNELIRTRCWINEIAIRDAIAHGSPEWEEGIVISFHRLSRVSTSLEGDPGAPNPEWDTRHRIFHTSMISACRSRWIIDFYRVLFDAAFRYQRLSTSTVPGPPRDVVSEHRSIMEAFLARDVEAAIALSNKHISHTAEIVLSSWTLVD